MYLFRIKKELLLAALAYLRHIIDALLLLYYCILLLYAFH